LSNYQAFIANKRRRHKDSGIVVESVHPRLFDFQSEVAKWALKKGRACVFAGTGLGKTAMQAEILNHCPGTRVIVAPLAVALQTIKEAETMGIHINRVLEKSDLVSGSINIINYDRFDQLEDVAIDAIALDESSILKSHDGKFRQYLTDRCQDIPMRFAFTATPSPNDYMELGTHAEFVGAMTRDVMLATYFTHDGGDTSVWRLKRHARSEFWQWVGSWAMVFQHPSDIGFECDGYDLPELTIHNHTVDTGHEGLGGLFGGETTNATNLYKGLRESAEERVENVAEIVAEDPLSPWLIWCNTDDEQSRLEKAFPTFATVKGSQPQSVKEDGLIGFATGKHNSLITKPKIAGFGMNWQRCNKMVFCGVTYSFEQVYQAIRRCYRFGQANRVEVHFVTHGGHEGVMAALRAKEEAFKSMAAEMRKYCKEQMSA
jgi:hypothetical protein